MKLEKIYEVKIPTKVHYKEVSALCGNTADQPNQPQGNVNIFINSNMEFQTFNGIGGSFSEVGGKALASLNDTLKDEVSKKLFSDNLNYFRLPVGASDFGVDAYSLNDNENDFSMDKFSLERDEKYVVPYMESVKKFCPDMKVHASPWSPPGWLKDTNKMCGGGSLIDDDKYYKAYALYFLKLIESYKEKGFDINRVNIQNEPDVSPAYPSCVMPDWQMNKFIKNYLHPLFKEKNIDTKIFAGTFRSINGASATDFLCYDEDILNYISGIGTQYTAMQPIYDIAAKYKDLSIMHTESNCFKGENSWEQAVVLYTNIVNYLLAGCDTFTYWNMILNQDQISTWGWNQNSLVTINEETSEITYNPDYYIMELTAKCITKNSKRIVYSCMEKPGIATKNEDGSITFMVSNFLDEPKTGKLTVDFKEMDIALEPMSITAFKVVL